LRIASRRGEIQIDADRKERRRALRWTRSVASPRNVGIGWRVAATVETTPSPRDRPGVRVRVREREREREERK
jgi:hypothetical protein